MSPDSKAAMEKAKSDFEKRWISQVVRQHEETGTKIPVTDDPIEFAWKAAAEFYEGRSPRSKLDPTNLAARLGIEYPQLEEKAEIRKLYISEEDWIKIYRGCDLGDSVTVSAYMYPHKSQLSRLIAFQSAPPAQESPEVRELPELFELVDAAREAERYLGSIRGNGSWSTFNRLSNAIAAYDAKKGKG